MTDNEIIKAWDILAKFNFLGGQRAGRELWNEKPVDVQNEDLKNFSEAVAFIKDFINRQDAGIEFREMKIKSLESERNSLHEMVAEQKAEIERLEKLALARHIRIYELNSENKTLRQTRYLVVRAEAIKEFKDKFKSNATACRKSVDGVCTYVVDDDFIDNLVKEMTEQSVNYGSSKSDDMRKEDEGK